MNDIPWNKIILEEFIEKACLTELEEEIIRMRVKGWTITKQAQELSVSESTVKKNMAKIRNKYDDVCKYSDILPQREHRLS